MTSFGTRFAQVAGLQLASAASLLVAADGAFFGDPPDQRHPWAVHDRNRPQPPVVAPGGPGQPPSDAIVLFDGTPESLAANWQSDKKEGGLTAWIARDGAMECVPKSGFVSTRALIGDCQLHIEWAAPAKIQGSGQGRGNSGIFLMGLLEVQVLDSHDNPTYADGSANAIYAVNPPLANALRPPGEFQSVDIVFRQPVYREGQEVAPGYVTVLCNGVLVQDHTPVEGPNDWKRRVAPRQFPEKGPLKLQDHGNPVRYRNIWYRELPPRAVEGGTDGPLSVEATLAKRHEIAAALRADAARLDSQSTAAMLRLAESLVYEQDPVALRQVEEGHVRFVAGLAALSPDELKAKEDEIKTVFRGFAYLEKYKIIPPGFGGQTELARLAKERGWDK